MAKVRVPIYRTSPTQSALIDPAATVGAQIGVNLLLPDGTLAKMSDFGSTPAAGVSPTTTDDLDEGQWNLWFTDRRAQDAVGAILTDSTTIDFTYTAGTSLTGILKDLADSGTGAALVKITRDAKGRVSGTSAATTTDLTEGSNLYFTTARVLATVLAGLSTASSAIITAADTVLSALGKLQAQITANLATLTGHTSNTSNPHSVTKAQVGLGNVDNTSDVNKPVSTAQQAALDLKLSNSVPAGYIDGLKMVWNSGTSVSVTSGAMYIQSLAKVVAFPSTLTLSGLSLAASTWYHLYGYVNSGTPAIELVTTAPAAAYSGTARAKTGDTSRRYIGSIRTSASGAIFNFFHHVDACYIKYAVDVNNFLLLASGMATTPTVVSAASCAPITAIIMEIFAESGAGDLCFISNPDLTANPSTLILFCLRASKQITGNMLLSSVQSFSYLLTPATSGLSVYGSGYYFGR